MVPVGNYSVVGTDDGVVFGGPAPQVLAPVTGLGEVFTTPTITKDGRVLVVGGPERDTAEYGDTCEVSGLQGRDVMSRLTLEGGTAARPAASSNFAYVITTKALYSLSAGGEAVEGSFPLTGAGLWSPAIGPERHIYALTQEALHIFPPKRQLPQRPRGGNTGRVGEGGNVG